MNKITPFLWFDANAEEAANFYISVFPNSRKLNELRVTEAGPGPAGSLLASGPRTRWTAGHLPQRGPLRTSSARRFPSPCDARRKRRLTLTGQSWVTAARNGLRLAQGQIRSLWQIVPLKLYDVLRHPRPCAP